MKNGKYVIWNINRYELGGWGGRFNFSDLFIGCDWYPGTS